MILPAEALRRRISRVQALIAYLDRVQPVDLDAYENNIALQLRIERVAQLLSQTLVDIGLSILERKRVVEGSVAEGHRPPAADSSLMPALTQAGILDPQLAERLADLPELAAILVHEYVEVDLAAVWRLWRERRSDLSLAASAFASYLTHNKVMLQL